METMHSFIVQLSLSLRTKILCVSGVPMNDLAPMKNCPGGGGCKVGQISSRGTEFCSMTIPYERHREKTGFSPMRNKGADQLRSNSEADQRNCFRYSDRTFPRRPPWPSG